MATRRCQQCGALIRTTRCRTCHRAANKHLATLRAPRLRPEYAGNWRYNSAQQRAQHVQLHGWNCFGLNHPGCPPIPPHPALDLVLDHDFGVMCRRCNAIKANTYDRHPHPPTTETRHTDTPHP